MKHECPERKRKESKVIMFYYTLHLALVSLSILLILEFLGLKIRSMCGLGMYFWIEFIICFILIAAIIVILILDKVVRGLQKSSIEQYIKKFEEDIYETDWFTNERKIKKYIQIIITSILVLILSCHLLIPIVRNIYRNEVWCKINYTGPQYCAEINTELNEYNEKIVSRDEAISIIEQYSDLSGDSDSFYFFNEYSEKYAVIYYGEEDSSGFIIEVYDVHEDENRASIIVGYAINRSSSSMGPLYKICFIPVSNNIDSLECEWRWHYR